MQKFKNDKQTTPKRTEKTIDQIKATIFLLLLNFDDNVCLVKHMKVIFVCLMDVCVMIMCVCVCVHAKYAHTAIEESETKSDVDDDHQHHFNENVM